MMNELKQIIIEEILANGPMPLENYMARALGDTAHGYYSKQDPFGKKGDFVTAPEVSQVFGELLGLWGLDFWMKSGPWAEFNIVELGPGRGTLMRDIAHSVKMHPAYLQSAHLHLLETSPVLQEKQNQTLSKVLGDTTPCHWHTNINDLLKACHGMPVIIYANEFFDALPIRQFVQENGMWKLKCVDVKDSELVPVTITDISLTDNLPAAQNFKHGDILETSPQAEAIMTQLANYVADNDGTLLMIDYGYTQNQPGETFQALSDHQPVSPYKSPGNADLTAHVNFKRLAEIAEDSSCRSSGPTSQRNFLISLGLEQRFESLSLNASSQQKIDLLAARNRLIGIDQMGILFNVLSITKADKALPSGFEEITRDIR